MEVIGTHGHLQLDVINSATLNGALQLIEIQLLTVLDYWPALKRVT